MFYIDTENNYREFDTYREAEIFCGENGISCEEIFTTEDTVLKYYFYIIDNEFNCDYDYEGYFDTHEEAQQFIEENEAVGNIVNNIAPYFERVDREEAGF